MRFGPSRSPSATILSCALAACLLAACGDDGTTGTSQLVPRGIVVLDGFVQPGLTLLPDSGPGSQRIALGAPDEFDAGSFALRNDTVIAASSRGAGDLLYVASLANGTVRRVQMPTRSNPSSPAFLSSSNGRTRIGVPLRDSSAVLLLSLAADGTTTSERIAGLGRCPVDVFEGSGALWVVDANAACASSYASLGAMRLIRVPVGGGTPQVIPLDGLRGSSAGVVVQGGVAYITAGGDADFSVFPFVLRTGGAIATVDLSAARVLGTRPLPSGTYGGSAKLGLDGNLHVSFFEDLRDFATRTISYRLPDLTPTGVRVTGRDWLALRDATGAAVSCTAGVADGLGRFHCLQNRAGSATFLMVFAPDGSLVREVAAGQGGVDLGFR